MKYMILIYSEPSEPTGTEEEQATELQRWWDYEAELREAGALISGDALQPVHTATTVRVRNDETVLTDGPFAETKEVLGGYYLIDVDDLDAAIDWAARCPSSTYGANEVRPLMEFDRPS